MSPFRSQRSVAISLICFVDGLKSQKELTGGHVHFQQKLSQVARQLNERLRKTLDYETPTERFNQCVALTS